MAPVIAVIGMLTADLTMVVSRAPDVGESMRVQRFTETTGGKGANAAVACYRTCHHRPSETKRDAEQPSKHLSEQPSEQPGEQPGAEPPSAPAEPPAAPPDYSDIQVRMIGAVGEDQNAEWFRSVLTATGVDVSGLRTVPGARSASAYMVVEEFTGENRVLFIEGATTAWKEEDFLTVESLTQGGPWPDLIVAQLEIRKEVVQQMIETAGKAGIDFCLNAAPGEPIASCRHLTHLLVNETEAAIMSGRYLNEVTQETWAEIAQEFLERGAENVVITLGEKGAYFANARDRGHVQAYQVSVVDVTGAGDTFTGTYASDYLRQKEQGRTAADWDIRSAVVRANKAAGFTIGKMGSQEGVPWADEIDRFEAPLNIVEKMSEVEIADEPSIVTEVPLAKAETGPVNE